MPKKIKVCIRIRNTYDDSVWEINNTILYQKIDCNKRLAFDCFQGLFFRHTNLNIFDECLIELLDEFLSGINCTVFAYGQTGSGKTHTMLGTEMENGLIKLSLVYLIQKTTSKQLKASYIEIYNEKVYDLLQNNKEIKLYNVENELKIANLSKIEVESTSQIISILDLSEKKRRVSATEYNLRSSRSHTIFQIHLDLPHVSVKLNLIDLAGSEKAAGTLERRKEGSYINKSLLALGTVVNSLTKSAYVNFRDSKLTRLLQPSLDGTSNVLSLCMISPNNKNLEESLSTLNFAARISKVVLKYKQNRMITVTENTIQHRNICERCKKEMYEESKDEMDLEKSVKNRNEENIDLKSTSKLLQYGTKNQKFNKNGLNSLQKNSLNSSLDNTKIEFQRETMILKSENELLLNRIAILEKMVGSMMNQNTSGRIHEIFLLEKNMFNLQLEMLKRKEEKS
ncbi:kinesin motor domain-containing protein [Hamiltosporidium tvaerminnensis]|uniref:Kinesin motor domain-containing protein n=1 Tax=Hamiltosporidium tvaerminnensis TaxID=1176355 RepID=A0A4Q9M3Q3_9MICR|nr:kinesin motor domain-containing protein [Hamiltosporidium tvaerminnensis]